MTTLSLLHESDFCLWATKSAELIKAGKFKELDIEHLVEEVESMGASEKRALESRLIELMQHLLKWQFQPEKRESSWEISINKQRVGIEKILQDNPSLKYNLNERIIDCYQYARRYAAIETKLPLKKFPEECLYSLEQLENFDFITRL